MLTQLFSFLIDVISVSGNGGFSALMGMLVFALCVGFLAVIIGMLGKIKSAGLFG